MDILSSVLRPGTAQFWALVVGSAVFYTVAMAAMKSWGAGSPAILLPTIAGTIILAASLEILALRGERLGMVYVSILAVEVVMIGGVSWLLFGESFSPREIAGCGLVIAGTAVAWS